MAAKERLNLGVEERIIQRIPIGQALDMSWDLVLVPPLDLQLQQKEGYACRCKGTSWEIGSYDKTWKCEELPPRSAMTAKEKLSLGLEEEIMLESPIGLALEDACFKFLRWASTGCGTGVRQSKLD